MAPSTRASITAAAATLVAGAAFLGTRYLALAVFVLTAALALGWSRLTHMGRPFVTAGVIVSGSALALVAVLLGGQEPYLRYMTIALGAVVVASLVVEVFVPAQPGHVVNAVAATAAGGAVAVAASAWVAADRTPGSEYLVVVGAITLALAAVFSALTSRAGLNTVLTFIFGFGAGAGLGFVFPQMGWYGGMLVGAMSAASVVLIHEMYRREPRPRSVWAGIASGVVPVLFAGVLVYLAGRLLIG